MAWLPGGEKKFDGSFGTIGLYERDSYREDGETPRDSRGRAYGYGFSTTGDVHQITAFIRRIIVRQGYWPLHYGPFRHHEHHRYS